MKKTNKKLLLALGTLTTVAAPVAAVVSCGTAETQHFNLLPTYTGQVDQLLALGIHPDYYPYQLDKTDVFGYISHPEKYISTNANPATPDFAEKFAEKLSKLMPSKRGTSWWNQQALQDGEKGSDPEYWQHMQGELVMYEHYLLDDGAKAVDASTAPKHYATDRTYLQTNFRESRDPFTRMPREIMEALLDRGNYDNLKTSDPDAAEFVVSMLDAARKIEGYRTADGKLTFDPSKASTDKLAIAVDKKPLPSGTVQKTAEDIQKDTGEDISWIYNDYFFAKSFHEDFLDNDKFMDASGTPVDKTAAKWILNSAGKGASYATNAGVNIFDTDDNDKDRQLAKLFFTATYTPEESVLQKIAYKLYTGDDWNPAWSKPTGTPASPHHPIYEQQENFGGAPMFEGAQRDNMLYFYNTASRLTEAFTAPASDATQEDKDAYKVLTDAFGEKSETFQNALHAQEHANLISVQLKERMANIKDLVRKGTRATTAPTFGLITLAPGEGSTTIQTMSKYSFLYNELGFAQPTPNNLDELAKKPFENTPGHGINDGSSEAQKEAAKMTLFNMDDNGWWWNLGDGSDASVATNAAKFKGEFDLGLVTANDTQYKALKNGVKGAFVDMFKDDAISELTGGKTGEAGIDALKVDYNLWNEGLKTPFVMNMMLDKITDMLVAKYPDVKVGDADTTKAYTWGSYWTSDYIKSVK